MEQEIGSIRCALLAVQSLDDKCGTLEQIRAIARRRRGGSSWPACGHSLHRDRPRSTAGSRVTARPLSIDGRFGDVRAQGGRCTEQPGQQDAAAMTEEL